MIRNQSNAILVAATFIVLAGVTSQGELIVYDGFEYPAGSYLNDLGHEDFAWGTQRWTPTFLLSDWEVYNGSLSHPSVHATGGHIAETNALYGADYRRSFDPVVLANGEAIWFSFLVEYLGATWNLYFNSSNHDESKFGVQGSGTTIKARIGTGTGPSTNFIHLGFATVRYVVGRYQYFDNSPDQLDLWLDLGPDSEPIPGGSSSSNHIVYYRSPESNPDPEPNIIDSVLLGTRSVDGLRFDELRVGTTWSSINGRALDRVRVSHMSMTTGALELHLKQLTPNATTVVEKTSSLLPPVAWTPLDSILVTNRTLIWSNAANEGTGYYRFMTKE